MTQQVTTTQTVERENTVSVQKAAQYSALDQVVYLIFGLFELLLLIRFFFKLTGANPAAGIVQFVYAFTNVLMAPFRFIFPTSAIEGAQFEWSVLVAIFFYALLAWVIMKLIRIAYTADRPQV